MTTIPIPATTAAPRAIGGKHRQHLLAQLSPRELEVLALMADGLSNSAIGEQLTVELKTVETHVSRVFTKLGLNQDRQGNRRVQAVLAYFGQGTALCVTVHTRRMQPSAISSSSALASLHR